MYQATMSYDADVDVDLLLEIDLYSNFRCCLCCIFNKYVFLFPIYIMMSFY